MVVVPKLKMRFYNTILIQAVGKNQIVRLMSL